MKVLTLPDVYQVKFGRATGFQFAIWGIISFVCLFASNLVGFGIDAPGGAGVAMRLVATSEGAAVLGAALVTMYIGVHLQLELRASQEGGIQPLDDSGQIRSS